jgi:hypothetical protein
MPGRPEGEGSARIEEQELEEAAHRHEVDEQVHSRQERDPRFFSKLFRRRARH